jgi:hypothetical protein
MMVKLPRDERRGWALAVAASVIVHGAVFAILPKHETYFSQKSVRPDRATPSSPVESAPPLLLSLVPEVDAVPTPARPAEARPTADAAETPTEPAKIAETGAGMGSAPSDEVGEPAPAGVPGDAHVGPPGEPSGLRRGVPAMGVGEGVLAGARINAPTDVRALVPAFDSSMVSGEEGQDEKGGGLGGFLRGVGDFLEGIEIRGGGTGGPGGGGGGGFGGQGGGGNIGRPHGFQLQHSAAEARCTLR